MANDENLYFKIILATELVERYTGRQFVPIQKNVRRNGRRNPAIVLDDTIIGIGEVALDFGPLSTGEISVQADDILVFNRHLTEQLRQPDDRNHPRLELFHIPRSTSFARTHGDVVFPEGVQNVRVLGVFGYTDPTFTSLPVGQTPNLIRRVTEMMVCQDLDKLKDQEKRFRSRNRWRLLREDSQQSSYQLQETGNNPAAMGLLTGDPAIDQILSAFLRPPRFGAV